MTCCPCNLCEERFVGCHAGCSAYIAWKIEQARLKDEKGIQKKAVMNGFRKANDLRWQRRKRGHK